MTGLDWDALRAVAEWLQIACLVGLSIYTWIVNRTKANKAAIDRVESNLGDRLSEHDRRISSLEHVTQGMPEAVRALNTTVGKLDGDLGTMGERLSGLDRLVVRLEKVVDRQEDHLLKGQRP